MLKEFIEKSYRNMLFVRIDDEGKVYYFSAEDFEGLHKQPFNFRTAAGNLLRGNFYFYDGCEQDRIVVFDHGMGCGHRAYMKEIECLARHGYMVYSYDHTGCADSEGACIGGFGTAPADLNACLNALKAEKPMGERRISVMGHSWGAFSTMNIAPYHPDVCHLVALAGPIGTKTMVEQSVPGPLALYRKHIMEMEKRANPEFAVRDGRKSLADAKMPVLVIHSTDDKTVSYKRHFKALETALSHKDNITFLTVTRKGHNPNYTEEAVQYKYKLFADLKKRSKKGLMKTAEQKKAFRDAWDWNAVTEQDPKLWQIIFDFLDR